MQKSSEILEISGEEMANAKQQKFDQVFNEFWAGNRILFFFWCKGGWVSYSGPEDACPKVTKNTFLKHLTYTLS